MYSMRGADLVIRLLERQGVETICGVPGGAILPIYDALSQSRQIRHVLARHEQGAGFMVQGMARSTGKPAVLFATSGPGATNALTAIADAKADSVPMVCITGQVASSLLGTDAFQEVDIYGMSIPVTKHNFLVRSALELLSVIPEAFRIASSGRPGPVLIDIPRDIQLHTVSFESWLEPCITETLSVPDPVALEKALAAIRSAKRPVLMVGGGIGASGAVEDVRQFARKFSTPVAMSLLGLGTIPQGDPLYLGMLGMHGARYTNMVLDECDLLLVVGARLDDRATGKVNEFCPDAKIIHIDIDPSELGKIRSAHIDVVGDAKYAFRYFLQETEGEPQADRSKWLERIVALRNEFPLHVPDANNVLSAYGIIKAVADILPADAIIATDVGQHQMRTAQFYPVKHPRLWLTSGGLGTMGFGLPAAIGAALAHPDKTVVTFSGDGSLLMNIQEMATAAEQGVNVKVILTNNNGLGLIHQLQDLVFEGRNFSWSYAKPADFIKISQGFGFAAYDLNASKNPEADLRKALTEPGPTLIQIQLDARDKVFPQVTPGAANTNMIGD